MTRSTHCVFSKVESQIKDKFHLSGFPETCVMLKQEYFLKSVIGFWKASNNMAHCILFLRPKTFLQRFAFEQRKYKAKHCRNVLGRTLGRKNQIQNRSFSLFLPYIRASSKKIFESEIGLWLGVSVCNSSGIAELSLLCYWFLFSLLRAHSAQLSTFDSQNSSYSTLTYRTLKWQELAQL